MKKTPNIFNIQEQFKCVHAWQLDSFINKHFSNDELCDFICWMEDYVLITIQSIYHTDSTEWACKLIKNKYIALQKPLLETIPYICAYFRDQSLIEYVFFYTNHPDAEQSAEFIMQYLNKYQSMKVFL